MTLTLRLSAAIWSICNQYYISVTVQTGVMLTPVDHFQHFSQSQVNNPEGVRCFNTQKTSRTVRTSGDNDRRHSRQGKRRRQDWRHLDHTTE